MTYWFGQSGVLALVAVWLWLPGCARSTPDGFDALAPEGRIDAIVRSARDGDRSRVPQLISQLDSDDPAVRMLAIRALERITGETKGYDHAASAQKRDEAVRRWVSWAHEERLAPVRDGEPMKPEKPDEKDEPEP